MEISFNRVKRLADLIHGASIGRPVANRASVTAIFTLEDGTEKKYKVLPSEWDEEIDQEMAKVDVKVAVQETEGPEY